MWYVGLPLIAGVILFATFGAVAGWQYTRGWPWLDWRQRLQMVINGVGFSLFALAMLNFALFWTMGVAIGGTADKVENGRFFIVSHGRHTEVSEEVWTFSYYHTRSIWITHPMGMLSIAAAFLSARLLKADSASAKEIYPEPRHAQGNDKSAIA
jgi:hypothetical protein